MTGGFKRFILVGVLGVLSTRLLAVDLPDRLIDIPVSKGLAFMATLKGEGEACIASIQDAPVRLRTFELPNYAFVVRYENDHIFYSGRSLLFPVGFSKKVAATDGREINPTNPAFTANAKRSLLSAGDRMFFVSTVSGRTLGEWDANSVTKYPADVGSTFTEIKGNPKRDRFAVAINPTRSRPEWAPLVLVLEDAGRDTLKVTSPWRPGNAHFAGARLSAPVTDSSGELFYFGVSGPDRVPSVVAVDARTFRPIWEATLGKDGVGDEDLKGWPLDLLVDRTDGVIALMKKDFDARSIRGVVFSLTRNGETRPGFFEQEAEGLSEPPPPPVKPDQGTP